jgi:hypothetical protein
MAAPVLTIPAGANAGMPATSSVTTNARVRAQTGYLALQTDVPQFPGPPVTGAWTVAASRVFVQQIPVVPQTATGIAAVPPSATVPMTVAIADSRVKAT